MRFYRFGAVCCVYYVLAQLFQEIVFHLGLNDSAAGAAEIAQRLMPLDQWRAVLLLVGFTLIPITAAYAGVTLRRYRFRPASSFLGFAFALLFVGFEMGNRSIDFLLVSKTWAPAYQAATSDATRQAIATRIGNWDDAVGALYFALLSVHLVSSAWYAIATWDREDRWARIVAVGFIATALECASRIAESYLGQPWLDGLNHAAYFPIVLLSFGSLAVWLWRAELDHAVQSTR